MSSHRTERILAIAVATLVGLALICFIAVIAGTSLGAGANDGFSHGIWPTVFFIQYYGLPLAFLLIVALFIVNGLRRSRAAKAAMNNITNGVSKGGAR